MDQREATLVDKLVRDEREQLIVGFLYVYYLNLMFVDQRLWFTDL